MMDGTAGTGAADSVTPGEDEGDERRAAERAGVDQQAAVIGRLRVELDALAATRRQHQQLQAILDGLESHLASAVRYRLGAVHVPLLIAHGLSGRPSAGVDLGAVNLALFLGIDLLDDLMDGDTSPYWPEPQVGHVMLASSTLLFAAAPALIARLPVDAEQARRLQARVSRCLMVMSDGQRADVGAFGGSVSPQQAKDTVDAKSGEMLAAFAEMGALYVGAEPPTVAAAGSYGRFLAQARQIGSDIFELLDPRGSSDVRNALPTLPVAHHLARLPESARQAFLDTMAGAGDSPEAFARFRNQLVDGEGLDAALVDAELACSGAVRAIEDLNLVDVSASGLYELIDDASIVINLSAFLTGERPDGR